MSEDKKQNVDIKPGGSKKDVAAGQNAAETGEPEEPLFIRESSEGNQGNAQDEKDETEE